MARPSARWTSLRDVEVESDFYRQVLNVVETADFAHLSSIALLRRQTPDLQCSIGKEFTAGRDHVVFEAAFSDGVFWIARIPFHALQDDKTMLCEAATMRLVRERTTIPVPQVFEVQHTPNQPFKHPYMLMECMPGNPLPGSLSKAVPTEHYSKVARQFAKILVELLHITFPHIGRWNDSIIQMVRHPTPGPLDSSLDYYFSQRQADNRAVTTLHGDDADWLTACWMLKLAYSYFIIEDKIHGPFPLCNNDLHQGNLLFDPDFNIVGVIDWTYTQAAPFEQLAITPELMTYPYASAERNGRILDFRRLVIDAVQDLEGGEPTLSKFMASPGYDIALRTVTHPPRLALFAGQQVAKLIYGNRLSWEQLKELYGSKPLV